MTREQQQAIDLVRKASAFAKSLDIAEAEIIKAVQQSPEPTWAEIAQEVGQPKTTK